MNINDFKYIKTVADLKSFSKAAKKCFVSQPALSQQIQKIEDEIGIQIFNRNKNETSVTAKGNVMVTYCNQVLDIYAKMKKINLEQDELRIGIIPTICPYLLPHILHDLNTAVPSVKFYFSELKTKDLLQQIKQGGIDIGILSFVDEVRHEKMIWKPLYRETFCLALHEKSQSELKDLKQLITEERLILLEDGNCLSENIINICSKYPSSSFNNFYGTSIETVKSMIKMNNGMGILPKTSCLKDIEGLKIIEMKKSDFRQICITSQQSKTQPKHMEAISQVIIKHAKALLDTQI